MVQDFQSITTSSSSSPPSPATTVAAPVGKAGPPSYLNLVEKQDVPIIASYCIYRDSQFLRSSLDSVCNYVDALVLLDGRFKDFPDLPEDGTNQIISDVASQFDPRFGREQKFAVFKTRPLLEVEKRDLTFQIIRPGCFAFIIDGDEICIGNVKAGLDFVRSQAEEEGINVFWVYVDEPRGNPGWKPRIIKIDEGLHYGHNHWTILKKDDSVLTDTVYQERKDFLKVSQFKIFNLGFSNRSEERRKQCVAYKDLMIKHNWQEERGGMDRVE